jgi:cytochrome c-type biogenesis protein CcsB
MVKLALNITLVAYLAASLLHIVYLVHRKPLLSILAYITIGGGLIAHTTSIGLRASETGHGPYTTSFEATMFFSWVIVVGYLLTQIKYKLKDLGSFVMPVAFLILLYSVSLSKEILHVPDSDYRVWITMHRTLSMMGFAAFALAFGAGLMYLIQENQLKTKKLGIMHFRMPSLEVLDNLIYKVVAIGFPLFTLGFMTGAIWNVQTDQKSVFSWDLVKTWPLVIGWLIYGSVFFGRLTVGLRGKKAAQGSIIGFAAVICTYFLHV